MTNLDILIKVIDQASGPLGSLKGSLNSLGSTASGTVSKGLNDIQSFLTTGLKAGAIAGGAALTGLGVLVGKTGTDFNSLKEQANIAFTTMLGDGEKAKAFLDDLQDFAAKTPFEFPDLLKASQRLLAMGFAAEDIRPTLTAIGDAVAGLGGGSAEVDRVTTALGQMQAKGKASAEEMMQLTEAGIPAWQFLADAIGTDVATAMDKVSKGAVSADEVISAVVSGMNNKFGGMMEKQSSIWGGLLSTIQDTFTQVSGTVMGPLFDKMTEGLKMVVEWTSKPEFTAGVEKFSEWLGKAVEVGIEWASDVLPKIWQFIQDLREPLADVTAKVKEWGGRLLELAQPVLDLVAKFVSWEDVIKGVALVIGVVAVKALAGFLAAMAPAVVVIGGAVAAMALMRNAWENDWGGIQGKTKAVMDYLGSRFGEMGEAIKTFGSDALGEIKAFVTGNDTEFTALGKIWDATKETGRKLFEDLGNSAKAIGGQFLDWFEKQFPEAAAALKKAFEDVSKRFSELWKVIQDTFGKGAKDVGDTLKKLQDWWKEHGDQVKQLVDNFLKAVITILSMAIQTMTNSLKLFFQIITGDWKGAWETIKQNAEIVWNAIKTLLGIVVDSLKLVWKMGLEDLVAKAREKWEEVKTIIGGKINEIATLVTTKWNEIKTTVTTKFGEIVTVVTTKAGEMVTGFTTGIANFATTVSTKMGEIRTAVNNAFADAGTWLLNAGQNVVQGFIDGIGNKISAAQAKVTELANLAAQAVTSTLGIDSPSKVFMGFGEQAAAGFGIGIERGMDKLEPMLNNVNTWAPEMGNTGSIMTDNSQRNFNVYVQASGDAVRDIRGQVELYALTFGAA